MSANVSGLVNLCITCNDIEVEIAIFFCISTYFLSLFLFKFISPTYKHTFISVNHIICNIACLKQTGKRILQLA